MYNYNLLDLFFTNDTLLKDVANISKLLESSPATYKSYTLKHPNDNQLEYTFNVAGYESKDFTATLEKLEGYKNSHRLLIKRSGEFPLILFSNVFNDLLVDENNFPVKISVKNGEMKVIVTKMKPKAEIHNIKIN